jgi:hypothetical protein
MPSTILYENALQLPQSARTNRPTGAVGIIRYDTNNRSLEGFYNPTGANTWGAIGGSTLIARATRSDAWNTFDIVWDFQNDSPKYQIIDVYFQTTDPTTTAARYFCQTFYSGGNLWNNSGSTGYTYTDNWASSNDGADLAGQNYNNVNGTAGAQIPITNWSVLDAGTGYWAVADGESQIGVTMRFYNSLPSGLVNQHVLFEGTYSHRANGLGQTNGRFGGQVFGLTAGSTATQGSTIYPITGLRFGLLDGYTARASSGTGSINTIVTVYGLTGTEEREL